MKHLTAIVTGCLLLAASANAQNSSLLHSQPARVVVTPQHGMPGMSVATAQAQGQVPELLPAPTPQMGPGSPVGPGASGPMRNGMSPNVMPPEYMPPVIPPMANTSPRNMPDIDPAIGLRGVSWTYQPAPPLRQFRVQDIVTIRVDEISRSMAEGSAEGRRNSLFTAVLSDWIKLTTGGIIPDPQEEGDPTVASQSQSQFRAESSVEARESVSFNIAARIVDIRPNGNLVLEARKKYRHNDNLWETALSGICRAQDIAADNVVLSRDLIDLEIQKEDRGYVRDGYQRGWFQRFFDRIKPF